MMIDLLKEIPQIIGDIAATLIYAMNGVLGRLNGEAVFIRDISDESLH